MRIKETNLGNGLSRLDVEPMFEEEKHIPTSVIDDIMKDIIKRKRLEEDDLNDEYSDFISSTRVPNFDKPSISDRSFKHPNFIDLQNREPDGIDIHVDRPLRQNFDNIVDWIVAMDNYRTLEDDAKKCDWECREPMRGLNEQCIDEEDDSNCELIDKWNLEDEAISEDESISESERIDILEDTVNRILGILHNI